MAAEAVALGIRSPILSDEADEGDLLPTMTRLPATGNSHAGILRM